jgi:hypothetical protein
MAGRQIYLFALAARALKYSSERCTKSYTNIEPANSASVQIGFAWRVSRLGSQRMPQRVSFRILDLIGEDLARVCRAAIVRVVEFAVWPDVRDARREARV